MKHSIRKFVHRMLIVGIATAVSAPIHPSRLRSKPVVGIREFACRPADCHPHPQSLLLAARIARDGDGQLLRSVLCLELRISAWKRNIIQPFTQNWGHLGFTAFLGQHGGGVDVTPESFNVFTGLVVNTVTPGSPASKIGLVPGDFILKIDGTAVDSYKQVAILFEQSEQGSKPEIDLTVWNPTTRRTSSLKAILDKH